MRPDQVRLALRANKIQVVERVAAAIQTEVAAYSGPDNGRQHLAIESAVGAAYGEFAALAGGRQHPNVGTLSMFVNLGWSEGFASRTHEAMLKAFHIAMREIWVELHRLSLHIRLTTAELGALVDLLLVLAGQLRESVRIGHRNGCLARGADEVVARDLFAGALLGQHHSDEIETLGAAIGWPPPEQALVLCVETPPSTSRLEENLLETGAFVIVDGRYSLILCDERNREAVLTQVRKLIKASPICISTPSPPHLLPDAVRMVKRAYKLIENKVIAPAGLVDCADHIATLWLQAEPLLREGVVLQLLDPLTKLSPLRRQVLGATLELHLQHQSSAPAIAKQLGVHPQTIRYRLRRLDAMFGKQMDGPETAFLMLMGLKTMLPLWAADLPTMRGPAG